MARYLIYNSAGEIKRKLTLSGDLDKPEVLAANVPAGMAAIKPTAAAWNDPGVYKVLNAQIVKKQDSEVGK
jgi:hypothetical protein